MINRIKEGLKKWSYAGVTKDVFMSCREEIENHNTAIVGKILLMAMLLFALYAIEGRWVPGFAQMAVYYTLYMVIMIMMYVYYRMMLAAGRKSSFMSCYILIAVLFSFCLLKEVFIHRQWPGTLFHIVEVGSFALFMLPFWYEICFIGAFSALYLLCAYMVKPLEVFQLDLANMIVTYTLAVLIAYVVDRERISYMLSKKLLTNTSTVDELTGIYNRRDFNEKVISSYEKERKLSLLMVDVDNFKSYNDTYGHLAGDKCLHEIGNVLGNVAQTNGCYAARYGGEEFVILGAGLDLREIRKIGWEAVSEIRRLKIENTSSPLGFITISAGAAEKDDRCMNAYTDLIREADNALYEAKKNGKNRVETLGSITRNISINRWHGNRAKKRGGAELLFEELSECIPDSKTVEDEIEGHMLTALIEGWLKTLTAEERALFVRRYWYGDVLEALAQEYGTTANKLAGKLFRLRAGLKKVLEREGVVL